VNLFMTRFSRFACVVWTLLLVAVSSYATADVKSYSSVDNLLLDGSAFRANETPLSWQDKTPLSGLFEFTYLGKDASHLNVLLKSGSGDIVFSTASNVDGDWSGALDISTLRLDDTSVDGTWWRPNNQYSISTWSDAVRIYQLDTDVIISGVSLSTGMFLFGFNDDYKAWFFDRPDYDDMVFAAKAVPIPGAALLLGSALIGMVGMRKKFMA